MMTEQHQHQFVTDYLARLGEEARRRLPADRAAELVEDIRAHLAEALSRDASEADVRNAVERLGLPSELVDEAGGSTQAPAKAALVAPRPVRLERWALGLLVLATACMGSVVFIMFSVPAAFIGIVLTFVSGIFTTKDKLLTAAAYVIAGAPGIAVAGFASFSSSGNCVQEVDSSGSVIGTCPASEGSSALGVGVLIALALLAVACQIWVVVRLNRRIAQAATLR